MSHDHAMQPATQSSPPQPAGTKSTKPASAPIPPCVFDDTFVGSSSTRIVPIATDSTVSKPSVRVTGDGFALREMSATDYLQTGTHSPKVAFTPFAAGKHRGTLTIETHRSDGSVEVQTVELLANATSAGEQASPQQLPLAKGPVRLTQLKDVDLGEQIVGSDHHFKVAAPQNMGMTMAHGAAILEPTSDLKGSWGMPGILNQMASGAELPA